ncbi:MAG: hypothetical protein BroJett011_10950 [Chloroflexota bacterium]|nr:MAG: hypothetical protein BroJett011_10950 [Chloroflexota bacterium]
MEIASPQHPHSNLIQALQAFCRAELGMRPRRIRVNLDRDAVIVLLEQALWPAEKQVTRTEAGVELLKTYEERLLEAVKPRLQLLVAEAIKRPVASAHLQADVLAGNVIGVFVLTEDAAHPDT